MVNKHQNNDIVAIAIRAKGGEFLEKKIGSADLMASVMMKGTKKYSQIELSKILEENGINISPSSGSDYFSVNVLTTKQQLPLTLSLLNEVINNAKFDDYEIEKTKKTMLQAIKAKRDVPLSRALENYRTVIFEGSVYSNTSKILEKNISKVQRNDILEYYNTIFYPNNLVISVNGDVDSQQIINEMSEMFKCKNGKVFSYSDYKNTIKSRTQSKIVREEIKDLQTSWIILGWQTDGNTNLKDFATLQVIDSFMGTGMSSRLFRHLREQMGLAYQIGTGFSPNVLKGSFTMYIGTNPATAQLSKDKMRDELTACNNKIEAITGIKPILFRAPYGDYNNEVIQTVRECGSYTIQWDVDSLDWKESATPDSIFKRDTGKVTNGSIVLFHNDADHTPEALPGILKCLKEQGYEFVFISDLILKDNYTIDHTGKQCPAAAE